MFVQNFMAASPVVWIWIKMVDLLINKPTNRLTLTYRAMLPTQLRSME